MLAPGDGAQAPVMVTVRKAIEIVLSSCLLLSTTAVAQLTDIDWNAKGDHASTLLVRAGRVAEACGKLRKGETVLWRFEASSAVDFNIHYHLGAQVEHAEKHRDIAKLEGRLLAPADHDYCWMWKAPAAGPAAIVELHLQRR